MEQLLTIKEAAGILNVKPRTVRYWVAANKINCPVYRLNGKNNYRFKLSDIEKLLQQSEVTK